MTPWVFAFIMTAHLFQKFYVLNMEKQLLAIPISVRFEVASIIKFCHLSFVLDPFSEWWVTELPLKNVSCSCKHISPEENWPRFCVASSEKILLCLKFVLGWIVVGICCKFSRNWQEQGLWESNAAELGQRKILRSSQRNMSMWKDWVFLSDRITVFFTLKSEHEHFQVKKCLLRNISFWLLRRTKPSLLLNIENAILTMMRLGKAYFPLIETCTLAACISYTGTLYTL